MTRQPQAPASPSAAGRGVVTELYRDDWVTITDDGVTIQGTYFAFSCIERVRVEEEPKAYAMPITGLMLTGIGLVCSKDYHPGPVGAVVVLVGLAISIWWFLRAPRYWLILTVRGKDIRTAWAIRRVWAERVAVLIAAAVENRMEVRR